MKTLSVVGTAAMFLVGGGILVHGMPFMPHWEGLAALALDGGVGVVAGAVVLAAVTLVQRFRR
jgi:predicted DNA repair protein MutK